VSADDAPTSLSRRAFLGAGAAAVGAVVVAGCSGGSGGGPGAPVLLPVTSEITAGDSARVELGWRPVRRARTYDVELNGVVVAGGLSATTFELRAGDGAPGFTEGRNRWRVRARDTAAGAWSAPGTFTVLTAGAVQARRFDHEDDGEIQLTTRRSSGTTLVVAAAAALGRGKGLRMTGTDPADAVASKNHLQQPVSSCWVRLAVRPQRWQQAGSRVHLARIHSQSSNASAETLVWTTGRGLSLTSAPDAVVPVAAHRWTQVQYGVGDDGTVELWAFDGRREQRVASARNPSLAGAVKDTIALGNELVRVGSTFQVDLDGFAVAQQRLPWANPNEAGALARPVRLDPKRLGSRFTFCFGSCNNPKSAPYRDTAVGAAARLDPDFLVHLGDYGYPDSNAYRQSVAGYEALWTDLWFEEQLARLSRKPWIYLASDHDMGRNDCDATTCNPVASRAYERWQNNDPAADGRGRYGSVDLDGGRVLLVWTEGIAFRSPLAAPDGPAKTVLGAKQRAWLFDVLAKTTAKLVIIASQTSIGFVTGSDWAQYPTERAQLIDACRRSPASVVRFVSGDYHHATWSRFDAKVAEWVAAPMAEFPEPVDPPAPLVVASAAAAIGPGFASRPDALKGESWRAFNAASSVGHVVIDANAGTATFEVVDPDGNVRTDGKGFTFREVVGYA
jgi:PhoD-like phosphatase